MIILASNSPRRKELLSITGWQFSVLPTDVDESIAESDTPQIYVDRTSRRKAFAAKELINPDVMEHRFILACDTVVVDGENILGKPTDNQNAREMLKHLRGRVHHAYSTLSIIDLTDCTFYQDTCITEVLMRCYSDREIDDYISTGDPIDKAGAYAIQHPVFSPVREMKGCYSNVMGLPLCNLTHILSGLISDAPVDVPLACQEYIDYDCQIFHSILKGEQ